MADRTEEILEGCLVQTLDSKGRSLFACNPISHETTLVAFSTSPETAAISLGKLRRFVAGLSEALAKARESRKKDRKGRQLDG